MMNNENNKKWHDSLKTKNKNIFFFFLDHKKFS